MTFCDATKWEVDIVDQMANNYNVNAVSQRWPVKHFYNISDLAAIDTYILKRNRCKDKTTKVSITISRGALLLVCASTSRGFTSTWF